MFAGQTDAEIKAALDAARKNLFGESNFDGLDQDQAWDRAVANSVVLDLLTKEAKKRGLAGA